jgi:hypothetical protein
MTSRMKKWRICKERQEEIISDPWSRALLEKLTVTHLIKKFPAFYWTRRVITVFTRASHWSLSWAKWIQSIPSDPISLNSSLTLYSYLRLRHPNGLYPFRFSNQNIVCISHRHHPCYMPRPSNPRFDHPSNIWWSVQVTKLLIMQSSTASRHFLPPKPKYSTRHSVMISFATTNLYSNNIKARRICKIYKPTGVHLPFPAFYALRCSCNWLETSDAVRRTETLDL